MNKTEQAKQIVKAGGWIRHGLETGYMGREQFAYRLFNADGTRASGFGYAALEPLTRCAELARDWNAIYGTTAQRIYRAS